MSTSADIKQLERFERLCLELAAAATTSEERAGLQIMANTYRAAADAIADKPGVNSASGGASE